jgi:hypothetical protein
VITITQTLDGVELNGSTLYEGQPLRQANNIAEFEVELNFDQDSPDARVATNSWEFSFGAKKLLEARFIEAANGGRSVLEGSELVTRVEENGEFVEFKQCLNLDGEYDDDRAVLEAVEVGRIDWLNENADSFRMEYLVDQGFINPDVDYVFLPYTKTRQYSTDDIITVIAIFYIVDKLTDESVDIQKIIAGLANPFTAPTKFIESAIELVYLITLLIALINLILDLLDLIIQPIKYHAGMFLLKQLQAGAEYLGKSFASSFLESDPWSRAFILPEKNELDDIDLGRKDRKIKGWLKRDTQVQKGFFNGTYGDLLRECKKLFNAKLIVTDTEIRLERVDYNLSSASYQLPDLDNLPIKYNIDEIVSNYEVKFDLDINDRNTYQNYLGTVYVVQTTPKTVTDKDKLQLSGFTSVSSIFARGVGKTELTIPEKVLKAGLNAASVVLNVLIATANLIIGPASLIIKGIRPLKPVDFGAAISNRIGMLTMENDIVAKPKLMLVTKGTKDKNNKISSDNLTVISGKRLYNEFHFANSFVVSDDKPNGNQWIRQEINKWFFCFSDFTQVRTSNRAVTVDGEDATFESLLWNPVEQTASQIAYRVNRAYDLSLTETRIEPDGK